MPSQTSWAPDWRSLSPHRCQKDRASASAFSPAAGPLLCYSCWQLRFSFGDSDFKSLRLLLQYLNLRRQAEIQRQRMLTDRQPLEIQVNLIGAYVELGKHS